MCMGEFARECARVCACVCVYVRVCSVKRTGNCKRGCAIHFEQRRRAIVSCSCGFLQTSPPREEEEEVHQGTVCDSVRGRSPSGPSVGGSVVVMETSSRGVAARLLREF